MVLIAPPPPLQPPHPVFVVLPAGTSLARLFDPTNYGADAITFRSFGPLRRFDHQEGIRRGQGRQASLSSKRRILYAALTLSCCIAEIFGDQRLVECGNWHLATPTLTRPLRLLDLRGQAAMQAGSVSALAQAPDHRLGQEWSRHFYTDSAYQSPDGLMYSGAHNGEDALALYERAEDGLACRAGDVLRLDDPLLRATLIDIGLPLGIAIASP